MEGVKCSYFRDEPNIKERDTCLAFDASIALSADEIDDKLRDFQDIDQKIQNNFNNFKTWENECYKTLNFHKAFICQGFIFVQML